MTNLYQATTRQSQKKGEQNDCSVHAVAIACGLEEDYEGVHEVFRIMGREKGKRTKLSITSKVIDWLGFDCKDVTDHFGGRTIRTLQREMMWQKGSFLVLVRGHILAIRDGKVHDWSKGRCHRIIKVWKIEEKEETKIDIEE